MASIKQSIVYRVWVVYFLLGFLALGIISRIIFIQFWRGDKYREMMENTSIMERSIPAIRGNILSDNGSLLATSLPKYKLGFDPNVADNSPRNKRLFNEKLDSLCLGLSKIFKDKSPSFFKNKILYARSVWVPRTSEEVLKNKKKQHPFLILSDEYISFEEKKKLAKIPLAKENKLKGGVVIERINERAHPFDNMGLRTIGYLLEKEGKGVGLEKSMDGYLEGRPGKGMFEKLKGDIWKPIEDSPETKPVPGSDIYTTIDVNIQDEAETALRKAVEQYQPNYASAIVMEVKTGEIKAIANLSYSKRENAYTENYNYAVAYGTTPGSTFKLPTMLALLEEGVNPNDSVATGNGKMPYKGAILSDSKNGGFGTLSVQEIFEKSSNIGIVKLTLKTFANNEQKYFDYLKKYRLDQKLGFQLKGEAAPLFYTPADKRHYSDFSLPYTSFGGIESRLTPLQMLTFYNAVANDGYWVQPIIVKYVKKVDKIELDFTEAQRKSDEPIASKDAIKKVKKMLEGVVEKGTARSQKSDIYRFAGKTGTSRKLVNGRFPEGIYYTAFAGYFPAENPKYSCIVVIDEPKGKNSLELYAADVAAPVFRQIADHIYADDLALNQNIKQSNNSLSKSIIESVLADDFEIVNNEKLFTKTTLKQSKINVNAKVKSDQYSVPNVVGLPLRDALYVLENKNFKVKYSGFGKVKKQSIPAGTLMRNFAIINLDLL